MDKSVQTELLDVAHQLADAARLETLKHFRTVDLEAASKEEGGFDPVTIADRDTEAAMREILSRLRPEDGILGEEFDATQGTSGLTWVLDPIDGTRAFICGAPTWGVLIALHDGTRPVFGIIDQPYTGERFTGGFGLAEMAGPHGTRNLRVSGVTQLAEAKIMTTFPEVGSSAERADFERVAARCKLTRYGMDCYAYALLAAGHIDLVVEAGLQAYDVQAPIAVIEAAGGVVTNWHGAPADQGGTVIAAATPELHAAALALLR